MSGTRYAIKVVFMKNIANNSFISKTRIGSIKKHLKIMVIDFEFEN